MRLTEVGTGAVVPLETPAAGGAPGALGGAPGGALGGAWPGRAPPPRHVSQAVGDDASGERHDSDVKTTILLKK